MNNSKSCKVIQAYLFTNYCLKENVILEPDNRDSPMVGSVEQKNKYIIFCSKHIHDNKILHKSHP